MQWLQEHAVEIFAIIGALYAAARGIVALTPTPKDDEVLSKLKTVVMKVAALFGLTLNQGVGSKPTSKTTAVLLVLLAMLVTGCTSFQENPRAQLLASQNVFSATVRSLAAASRAGQIGDDEFVIIDSLIQRGNNTLLQWESDVKAGKTDVATTVVFNRILIDLTEWARKVETKE